MKNILIKLFIINLFAWPMCISEASVEPVTLRWLDDDVPQITSGVSWGVPWPKGAISKDQSFMLTCNDGKTLPLQIWPLAYWPDGSLKWSGFATIADSNTAGSLKLKPKLNMRVWSWSPSEAIRQTSKKSPPK